MVARAKLENIKPWGLVWNQANLGYHANHWTADSRIKFVKINVPSLCLLACNMGTDQESSWHGCARLGCVHRIHETWVPAQNWCSHPKLMKLLQIQQLGYRVEAWSTALPISRSAINFDADSVRLVMQLSMEGKYNQSQTYRAFFPFWNTTADPTWQAIGIPQVNLIGRLPPFRLDSPGGRSLIFHRIRYSIKPDKIKGLVGGMLWITGK